MNDSRTEAGGRPASPKAFNIQSKPNQCIMKNEGPNVFGRMPAVPKFLASLLLMLALSVTAAAQNRKISIDMQNITVKEFLRRNRETAITFAYNNSEIDLAARERPGGGRGDRRRRRPHARASAAGAMRIEGKFRIGKLSAAAVPLLREAREGRKEISGRVTAVSGEPIVGASVIVKGRASAT